jgi:hypothetical protein
MLQARHEARLAVEAASATVPFTPEEEPMLLQHEAQLLAEGVKVEDRVELRRLALERMRGTDGGG